MLAKLANRSRTPCHSFVSITSKETFSKSLGLQVVVVGGWSLAACKKKGGKIDWAYGWQRQCVKAIYTLQKCESVAEINECKRWIASFISAAPDMNADLKRAVRMFFQRKYALRTQWVLAFRIRRRGFNVAASSRVEGEFGVLNKLNMSSSLNFRTGITKMRYSALSRNLKKRYRAERWSSSTVIRDAGSCGYWYLQNFSWEFCERSISTSERQRVKMSERVQYIMSE